MTSSTRPQSSGQTLPLFAILVPGMLALMALGLDSAQVFLERRDAQGSADLAALAGVKHLPDDPSAAETEAIANAAANGYSITVDDVVTPYDGDPGKIEVIIPTSVDTFFLNVLDVIVPGGDYSTIDVSARAVAAREYVEATSGFPFAIFALESCPSNEKSVDISGSTSIYGGLVHSNSDVYISGSDHEFNGGASYTCGSPPFHDGGGSNDFDPGPTAAPNAPNPEPDPVAKTISDFECDWPETVTSINGWSGQDHTYSGDWDLSQNGSWWVGGTKSSETLRPGTYCSDGSIKLGDSDIGVQLDDITAEGVTFAAQNQIEISGSNVTLTAHERLPYPILLYSAGNSDVAIKISGSGNSLEGIIYAPSGTAEVSGQDAFNYTGGIVGERVKFNGSNGSLSTAEGEGGPGQEYIALIE